MKRLRLALQNGSKGRPPPSTQNLPLLFSLSDGGLSMVTPRSPPSSSGTTAGEGPRDSWPKGRCPSPSCPFCASSSRNWPQVASPSGKVCSAQRGRRPLSGRAPHFLLELLPPEMLFLCLEPEAGAPQVAPGSGPSLEGTHSPRLLLKGHPGTSHPPGATAAPKGSPGSAPGLPKEAGTPCPPMCIAQPWSAGTSHTPRFPILEGLQATSRRASLHPQTQAGAHPIPQAHQSGDFQPPHQRSNRSGIPPPLPRPAQV